MRKGLTLIELLIVISILCIGLAVVVIPVSIFIFGASNVNKMETFPAAKAACVEMCDLNYPNYLTTEVTWTEDEKGEYWKCACKDKYNQPLD